MVALTEQVIAKNSRHPGALHMYIHLMESVAPEKAEKAADMLLTLMPAAGHMVHMPAHIYQRVGRFAEAMRANELAIAADEDYIAQCSAQGLYPMAYYPHNIHFLWFAASSTLRAASRSSRLAVSPRRSATKRSKACRFSPHSGSQNFISRPPTHSGLKGAGHETVYWEDLRRNRDNGWALFGLLEALRAQDKTANAALVEARFAKAWARADVKLTASRFGRPVRPGPTAD